LSLGLVDWFFYNFEQKSMKIFLKMQYFKNLFEPIGCIENIAGITKLNFIITGRSSSAGVIPAIRWLAGWLLHYIW